MLLYFFMFFVFISVSKSSKSFDVNKVIYAVNAGGNSFVDSLGIKYDKDPLHQKIGVASDYGKALTIRRVPEKDYELYQVERYHHSSFGYEIPIIEDGDYVLVLKFCEVYFMSKNSKVFDVALNGVRVIENLDIFDKVGRGTAHDVYIPFSIRDNVFVYKNMESFINNGKVKVEFLKGRKDNPKVNAIIVFKGIVTDFPKLPRVQFDEKIIKFDYPEVKLTKNKKPNVPKTEVNRDPYAIDHPAMLWPVCIIMFSMFSFFYSVCRI